MIYNCLLKKYFILYKLDFFKFIESKHFKIEYIVLLVHIYGKLHTL